MPVTSIFTVSAKNVKINKKSALITLRFIPP